MSVLIKGMEMPRACVFCELYEGETHWCRSAKKEIPYSSEYERADDCPLVEIPPHGRLIDADALQMEAHKRLMMCNKNNNQIHKPYEMMKAIVCAPTIIEAEEGET